MVSSVRSRPNHYEVLGLGAAAGAEDIARAFASKMRVAAAGPLGAAAQICAAHETLRDPSRRREYDRSIGLAPKPKPQGWTVAAPQPHWAPFAASATARPAAQPASEGRRSPVPSAAAPPAEPVPQPRTSSFIAASLRELAKPAAIDPAPEPRAEQPSRAQAKSDYVIEPDIRKLLATAPIEDEADDERAFNWKRPAMAVGGLVAAAGLIGTMAGLWARDGGDPAQAEPAVTMSIPAAKTDATPAEAAAAPVAETFPAQVQRPVRAARSPVRARAELADAAEPAQPADNSQLAESAAMQSGFVESATEQAAADPLAAEPAEAAQTTAADLPLPNNVVARTIERIGYACGSVASTTAAQGGFKVTCTSGDSYRAAPVHGRYRFRRWGSH
jgi:hypothetical protein